MKNKIKIISGRTGEDYEASLENRVNNAIKDMEDQGFYLHKTYNKLNKHNSDLTLILVFKN